MHVFRPNLWKNITLASTKKPLGKRKQPKAASLPRPEKSPKAKYPIIHDGPLCWRFSECDHTGTWAWSNLSDPDRYKEVVERLHKFEKMHWSEIISSGSHPVQVADLIKPAQDRLQELHKDDIDELMSFRIDGTKRVWCIQTQNVMRVLWWDPDHEICPSPKKYT